MKYRLLFVVALLGAAAALLVPGVSAQAYPPTTCPMLSVSTTTPQAGQPMRVAGSHFRALAHVTIALDTESDVLAHVTTNAQGKFSTRVTLPANKPGRHTLKAFGGQQTGVPSCPAHATQSLRIQSAANGPAPSSSAAGGGGGGGGGTAFTGVDIAALVALALLLIGLGVTANRRGSAKRAMGTATRQ